MLDVADQEDTEEEQGGDYAVAELDREHRVVYVLEVEHIGELIGLLDTLRRAHKWHNGGELGKHRHEDRQDNERNQKNSQKLHDVRLTNQKVASVGLLFIDFAHIFLAERLLGHVFDLTQPQRAEQIRSEPPWFR